MSKFYGQVGYADLVEHPLGVWTEQYAERYYFGDITHDSRVSTSEQAINDELIVSNRISILADAYAFEHIHNIRYVTWMGTKWKVKTIEVQRPRLVMSVGGVFNGE